MLANIGLRMHQEQPTKLRMRPAKVTGTVSKTSAGALGPMAASNMAAVEHGKQPRWHDPACRGTLRWPVEAIHRPLAKAHKV